MIRRAILPFMTSTSESGVAILYILLAVMLFAALGVAFSQGMRQGVTTLNEDQAKVYAQDIISYASRLDRGVQRVMSRGTCAESDLSFYLVTQDELAEYRHAPETNDACKIFHTDGGLINWLPPAPDVNNGENWVFSGANRIAKVGSDTVLRGNDLVAFLPQINRLICLQINKQVGIVSNSKNPPREKDDVLLTPYIGVFESNTYIQTENEELDGKNTGCFQARTIDGSAVQDTYYFYHTLITR